MPGLKDVRNGLVGVLEAGRGYMDGRLQPYGMSVKKVFPFEKYNVETGLYPCLMISAMRKSKKWVASGSVLEHAYECDILGYTHFSDDERNDEAIHAFADAVEDWFESFENFIIQTPDQLFRIHLGDTGVPIAENEVGLEAVGGNSQQLLLRMFTAKWVGFVDATMGFPNVPSGALNVDLMGG